jgi:formamidopyrimidine-DNA glycosylase
MPELPEVETTCRGLAAKMVGQILHDVTLRRSGLRRPFPIDLSTQVAGTKITAITRHSKYALMHLDNKGVIIIHLGMSGRMAFMPYGAVPDKHDHVIFHYGTARSKKPAQVFFNDARRFGVLDYTTKKQLATHPLLKDTGIDPFDPDMTGRWLFEQFQKRKAPIKATLMDQKVIAGLGNIYVCEALFLAKVQPERPTNQVTAKEATALVKAIHKVLEAAITAGGSSLRDYAQTDGTLGYFQNSHNVYGREDEPCVRCKTPVQRIVQAGRSSFFCPQCQV